MAQLSNSPRNHTLLTLEARKSFAFGLKFRDTRRNPVDLTGADVRLVVAQMKRFGGAQVIAQDATVLDAELGLVQFELQADDLDLVEGEYPFALVLQTALGYSTLVLKGSFSIRDNVETESVSGVYAGVNPSTNMAVYLEEGNVVNVLVENIDGLSVIVEDRINSFTTVMDAKVAEVQTNADLSTTAAHSASASAVSAAASAELAESVALADAESALTIALDNPSSTLGAALRSNIAGDVTDGSSVIGAALSGEIGAAVAPLAADVDDLKGATQGLYQRGSMGSFRALAADPNVPGRVWGVSSGGISYFNDHGAGARNDVGAAPSAQSGVQMAFRGSYLYLVTSGNASRAGQIWRSPAPASTGTPTLTWTKVFDLANFTTTLAEGLPGGENSWFREQSLALSPDDNSACVLEYGDIVTGGPSVYYTGNLTVADTAIIWTKRQTFTDTKHGHGVRWINGTYWAMFGDATYSNLGLWRGAANGSSWMRRSAYGEVQGGNTLYGINLIPATINGADVILTDNDTKRGFSILMFPSQGAVNYPLVPLVSAKPPYFTGTVRSICLTSEGNLMWVQTGENGAANPFDSIWVSKGPDYREAVLLEAIPSTNALSTLGTAVESGDFVFVGSFRLRKEKFPGQ